MKVPAFKPVEPTPYSVSPTQASSPQTAISPAAHHDRPDSTPGMAQCLMCDSTIASTDTDVYLCKRCFPFDPLGDDEFDIGWMNELLDASSSTEEAPSTPTDSTGESSPSSTPSTASPPTPTSPTPDVSRKRRHTSEDKACSNCGTTKTSMWRRDPEGNPLCNACGQHFKKFKTNRPSELSERPIKKRMRKSKLDSSSSSSTATTRPFQAPIAFDMYSSNFAPMPSPYQQMPQFLPPPPMHPGWNNPMPFPPPAPWAFQYPVQQFY